MGHLYHTPSPQASEIIAEEGVERLSEPEAVDTRRETVFAGCDVTRPISCELTVAVTICTKRAQEQAVQHPNVDREGLTRSYS